MDKRSLPDRLATGLDIVSIGINPSVYSVERGFNFARPGNRFWPAFNAAGLVAEPIEPGKAAVARLLRQYRIGFTDLVRRPTERADQLTDKDFREGALALKRKLLRIQPRIAWFQGVTAYAKYLQHAEGLKRPVKTGLQPEQIGATHVFVTPNPSGANPAANPRALLQHFIALRNLRDAL
jgi:TDG/mug DNA glycosylase family protein